mgnify:CR=1 FL=1
MSKPPDASPGTPAAEISQSYAEFVFLKLGMDSDQFLVAVDAKEVLPLTPRSTGRGGGATGRPSTRFWQGAPLRRIMPLTSYNRVMQKLRTGMAYEEAVPMELERLAKEGKK